MKTLGILASKFGIYYTQINIEPKNIEKVVMVTCILHNFLMEHGTSCAPSDCFYRENTDNGIIISTGYNTASSNMDNLDRRTKGNINQGAKRVRQEFVNCFVTDERLSWQDNYV